jgi:hypothetical protein
MPTRTDHIAQLLGVPPRKHLEVVNIDGTARLMLPKDACQECILILAAKDFPLYQRFELYKHLDMVHDFTTTLEDTCNLFEVIDHMTVAGRCPPFIEIFKQFRMCTHSCCVSRLLWFVSSSF